MDDDEWYVPPVKHYKLALYPHCDTRQISERRKRVWEKAFEQLSEAKENSPFDPSVQQHSSKKNVEVPVLDENGQFQTYDYFNDNEINNEEDSEDDITFSEHLREGATEHPNLNKSSNFIDNGDQVMFDQSGTTVNDVIEMVVAQWAQRRKTFFKRL